MNLEWKLSDVLAVLTIAGGVVSYTHSMYKEREIKTAEHADKVRATAAQLLGKINALHNSVPNSALEARQRVVATKVGLLSNYEPRKALHSLWGSLLNEKGKALLAVSSLQIDASYLAFYTFSPNTKKCVDGAIHKVEETLQEGYRGVLKAVEAARVKMPKNVVDYVPANLYNVVSEPLNTMESASQETTKTFLTPIETHLIQIIGRSNEALNEQSLQSEEVKCGK